MYSQKYAELYIKQDQNICILSFKIRNEALWFEHIVIL